ncbi:D-ribitol-5-phosphate cytidylyltransferase-like [Hetaerina americana]|uniref:D-ribitol-5-phosphate cytidylyltransferase-like n=1 Tax=Hetaerina americana TaxID=62018 RepID=UPI003A7F28B5
MINFEVGVILPSAGSSERLDTTTPKQYCKILGKPLFLYALEEFDRIPWVKSMVLVADSVERARGLLDECGSVGRKVAVVQGETSRHRSIRAGLLALQKSEPTTRVVVVHDAVRPMVPAGLLEQLVLAAERCGAAGATRPLVSTIVASTGPEGLLDHCLDRSTHISSETPQAFRLDTLCAAYSKCTEHDLDHGTECLQLALAYAGVRAQLIEGPPDLWKVTYKRDIYAAIGCLRENKCRVCIVAPEECEVADMLMEHLAPKVSVLQRVVGLGEATEGHFNAAVFFHRHNIAQGNGLLDPERPSTVVHVFDHDAPSSAGADGMWQVSVQEMHRGARHREELYGKEGKSVAVVHWVTAGREGRLVRLVSALILLSAEDDEEDADVFSGQTLFV